MVYHTFAILIDVFLTDVIVLFRTSTGTFDALRGRYFPGGPTPPEGMDADMMFKVIQQLEVYDVGHVNVSKSQYRKIHNFPSF